MDLSNLKAPAGSRKKRLRVGRGEGSGTGKTSGRGQKGAGARTGRKARWGYEGGQMPLQRRLPKRGFKNPFRTEYAVVNLSALDRFDAGTTVDWDALRGAGLLPKSAEGVKILAQGELTKALTVRASAFSDAAKKKIEAAGGRAEVA